MQWRANVEAKARDSIEYQQGTPWPSRTDMATRAHNALPPHSITMAFEFSTSAEGTVLVVRIGGERPAVDSDTVDQLWSFFERAASECCQEGIRRMLVVSGARGSASSAAVLSFYRRLEAIGLDLRTRIAVVVTDDAARRVTQLGVAVAKGRGWDIALFETEQEARAWVSMN